MQARAPGKIVLSGAYSVLHGAPAVVAAVDRYVLADTAREAERVTDEVAAAMGVRAVPWFDASALRTPIAPSSSLESPSSSGATPGDRKLGLGSSAAILVASLAARMWDSEPNQSEESLRVHLFPTALAAHRLAQGGGSGVDVAASTFGGWLRFEPSAREPRIAMWVPPMDLQVEVWASERSVSTAAMLAKVEQFRDRQPHEHERMFAELVRAAGQCAEATSSDAFIDALRSQRELFVELGSACQAEIVLADLHAWDRYAREQGGVVLPSGAGGGDLALWVAPQASSSPAHRMAHDARFFRLPVTLGARGVHAAGAPPP